MEGIVYPSVLESYGKRLDDVPWYVGAVRMIDDPLNSIFGIAPFEPLYNILRDLAPANVIRTLTGLEKPSEIVNEAIDDVAKRLRDKARTIKRP